ncbi:hypothetical protein PsYK624_117300 [Phanerochaete sordida]|uniref:Uncharacterized protein n=1 Tax=Phanerochaete sordida TaxID=48140 RepID=A0A9P3LID2_9APHY|nr:hypothetical protein PsYK624_117300 [Phanerochaete sordida]
MVVWRRRSRQARLNRMPGNFHVALYFHFGQAPASALWRFRQAPTLCSAPPRRLCPRHIPLLGSLTTNQVSWEICDILLCDMGWVYAPQRRVSAPRPCSYTFPASVVRHAAPLAIQRRQLVLRGACAYQ